MRRSIRHARHHWESGIGARLSRLAVPPDSRPRSGSSPAHRRATASKHVAKAGFQAFDVPIPGFNWRNQGQAFDRRPGQDGLRSTAPQSANFALRGGGALTAGDAAAVASLERFHLLWFDEPRLVKSAIKEDCGRDGHRSASEKRSPA